VTWMRYSVHSTTGPPTILDTIQPMNESPSQILKRRAAQMHEAFLAQVRLEKGNKKLKRDTKIEKLAPVVAALEDVQKEYSQLQVETNDGVLTGFVWRHRRVGIHGETSFNLSTELSGGLMGDFAASYTLYDSGGTRLLVCNDTYSLIVAILEHLAKQAALDMRDLQPEPSDNTAAAQEYA